MAVQIQAIQYDNTAEELLQNQQKLKQQQQLIEQKDRQDKVEQTQKLMEMINPMVLNDKLESEVSAEGVAALRKNVFQYMMKNKNAGVGELQQLIQGELGKLSAWSSRVKTIKAKHKEQAGMMPNDPKINKANWINAATTKALYKPDGNGGMTLRSLDELDETYDYIGDAWNNNGEAFTNLKETETEFDKSIKEFQTEKKTVEIGRGGNKKKEVIEIPAYADWDENKQQVVLKAKVGEIFLGGKGTPQDNLFTKRTRDEFIQQGKVGNISWREVFDEKGKIISPEKFEAAKNELVKQRIQKFSPIKILNSDVTKPATVNNFFNGTQSQDAMTYHPSDIADGIQNGVPEFIDGEVDYAGKKMLDVTSAWNGFMAPHRKGNKMVQRVYYDKDEKKMYYSVYPDGDMENSSTPDGAVRIFSGATPGIGMKSDGKIYKKRTWGNAQQVGNAAPAGKTVKQLMEEAAEAAKGEKKK
jgi:hypothetical protein